MYLKRIELLGFKSFTDKTQIQLEPGISCIVGPNGSGKSNIADALRWVFGEQSAKTLRGGKLEDVIFAGSKKRRALGMAEVSIILDNSDSYLHQPFTEVVVTRRVFRSGQSEYLLNNKPCRLKDIHNLFIDSGVGLEGISLIGQDKIHEIIHAKPEERRMLVEETAGILKYRNRKKEALRKLEETERHLERVSDIINELSSRLQPLSEQSEIAGRYLSLNEEADQLEIALIVNILSETKEKLTYINKQLQQVQNDCLDKETHQLQLETQAEELNLLIANLDQEASRLQQQFYQLKTQKEQLFSDLKVLSAQKEACLQNKARLEKELEDINVINETKQEQIEALKAQIQELSAAIDEQQKQIVAGESDEKSRKQAVAFLQDSLDKAKEQIFASAGFLADCRNKIRYQKQLSENNLQAIKRLEQQKAELDNFLFGLSTQEKDLHEKIQNLKKQREHQEYVLSRGQKDILGLNENVQELAGRETDCRYRVHALSSRLAILEEMAKNYEGFFPGIKSILLAKKQEEKAVAGVIDAMASLLDVPSQYQVAIETYLGASLQSMVAETEAAAKSAIAYLKTVNGGRATFLPLDTLKVREKADFSKALSIKGVYGRASELVSYPLKIKDAVDFLLANTLIVSDLDVAAAAAKAVNYRYSVVTLEGDMINPGATLSGGSKHKKSADLLSKKSALKTCKEELVVLEKELVLWVDKLQAARLSLAQKQEQVEKTTQEIRDLTKAIYAAQKDQEQLLLSGQLSKKQLSAIMQEIKNLRAENKDIAEKEQELALELQQKEYDYDLLMQQVEKLQQQLAEKQTHNEAEKEDITAFKVKLAGLQQKITDLQQNEQRLASEIEDNLWEQESKCADLDQLIKELGDLIVKENDGKGQLLLWERQAMEKEAELTAKRHGLSAEMEQSQQLKKRIKEQSQAVLELRSLCHQLELKKTRLESEWYNEEHKLQEKFCMTFDQAVLLEKPQLSPREMTMRLKQLREQITALGIVNIAAIEEYKAVSERHQFLTEQRQDLLEAIDSLHSIVKDMDTILTSQFVKVFEQLSQEFNKSFARLFNGGTAALVMSQPDNILETGVEMAVQPPGKKVINHNLLSGGEKTLVGLSFLFAVLAVRPMPFCVMDEVDAALDESNVNRFADYIKDLAQNTQFLLISHRQGTMETASSLWGVTMAEEGISKIISVKL
ncbi:MAG: chromosome segregation protein SMC [Bacillota bacterium]|jgi:chromosome segregation protein